MDSRLRRWKALAGGNGTISARRVLSGAAYTVPTAFEGSAGTNPESSCAAPVSGCFSMALSHASPGRNRHHSAPTHRESRAGEGAWRVT